MNLSVSEIVEKIISTEELQNFSEVEKKLERIGEGFIFQNNRPTHVLMTLQNYEKLQNPVRSLSERERSESLEPLLNKVGKRVFVTYYESFRTDRNAEKALEQEFTPASSRSRSSAARIIFRNHWQEQALEQIIASDRMDSELIEKAQRLLEQEKSHSFENPEAEEEHLLKIGKMMRGTLTKLMQNAELSEEELLQLQEPGYSKEILNLNFPVLKVLKAEESIDEAKRDAKGYNRYYDVVVNDRGVDYLICSQWVEALHKAKAEEWITAKMLGILEKQMPHIPNGTEFTVRELLSDYWPYISGKSGPTVSIGRKFKKLAEENGWARIGNRKENGQSYIKI